MTVTGSPGSVKTSNVEFDLSASYLLTDRTAPYEFQLPTTRWVDGSYALSVRVTMTDGFVSAPGSVGVVFANGVTEPPVNPNTFVPRTGTTPPPGSPLVVAAVADAAGGMANSKLVSDMIYSWNPNLFLYLGDVYERGSPTEFLNWYGDANNLFGRLRSITDPAPGNHEWDLGPGATGYVDYWDNAPQYYSVDAAGWHVVSLDSDPRFGGTQPGSAQYQWLAQDLAASSALCTLAIFHHPRFSVGQHGDNASLASLWSLLHGGGVDIVIVGHDHDYQRGSVGRPGAGPSGWHDPIRRGDRRSLRLRVHEDRSSSRGRVRLLAPGDRSAPSRAQPPGRCSSSYASVTGRRWISLAIPCREAPTDTQAPTAPTNLHTTSVSSTQVGLSWDPSTDNIGVTGYDVFRNAQLLQSIGPGTTFTDLTVSPNTLYAYTVRC